MIATRPRLCKCGCGKMTNPGRDFINHHNGRAFSDETRRKISENTSGINNPRSLLRPSRDKLYNSYINLEQSSVTLAATYGVDSGAILRWLDYYGITTRTQAETRRTTPAKRSQSETNRQWWANLTEEQYSKVCGAISLSRKRYFMTISEDDYEAFINVRREWWKDTPFKNEVVRASIRGNNARPTRPEQFMMDLIKAYSLPFRYNGNNGETIVEGLCPDFVSTNGVKIVILVDGIYWHGDPTKEAEKDKTYKLNGYKVLHFTDKELYSADEVHIVTMINLELKGLQWVRN